MIVFYLFIFSETRWLSKHTEPGIFLLYFLTLLSKANYTVSKLYIFIIMHFLGIQPMTGIASIMCYQENKNWGEHTQNTEHCITDLISFFNEESQVGLFFNF